MKMPLNWPADPRDDEKSKPADATDESHAGENGPHAESDDHSGDHSHSGADSHGHGHEEVVGTMDDWSIQKQMDYYLAPDHLIAHVQDQTFFERPTLSGETAFREPTHVDIWNPLGRTDEKPLISVPPNDFIASLTFAPTKFIVLELFAAILVAAVFISLGQKIKSGKPVKGRFWNMLEAGCLYVRDEIARPSIGTKDSERYLPFLWTVFFFVLAMNLIGMIPGLGAATGSISITASIALVVFLLVISTGSKKLGAVGFWKAQVPHMDLSGPIKYLLIPMIWAIEVFGLFIKHLVLAVRLFANMFAGHLVLAVFVAFIGVAYTSTALASVVWPGVIAASVGISLLELLVAFIQAYVFTFLTALFIGSAIHPH